MSKKFIDLITVNLVNVPKHIYGFSSGVQITNIYRELGQDGYERTAYRIMSVVEAEELVQDLNNAISEAKSQLFKDAYNDKI